MRKLSVQLCIAKRGMLRSQYRSASKREDHDIKPTPRTKFVPFCPSQVDDFFPKTSSPKDDGTKFSKYAELADVRPNYIFGYVVWVV